MLFITWQLAPCMILHWRRHKQNTPFIENFFHAARCFDESFCEKRLRLHHFSDFKDETSLKHTWLGGRPFCKWPKLHIGEETHSNLSAKMFELLWKQFDNSFEGKTWKCIISWRLLNCFVIFDFHILNLGLQLTQALLGGNRVTAASSKPSSVWVQFFWSTFANNYPESSTCLSLYCQTLHV